jgi:hypothetical protein
MPKVQLPPRKVSKRHLIGNSRFTSSGVAIAETQTIVTATNELLQDSIFDNEKIVQPYTFGAVRFMTGEGYAPLATIATAKTIIYTEQTIISKDVFIQKGVTSSHILPRNKGIYRVSAYCLVTPENASATAWTSHELQLWRNGAFYSMLDAEQLVTTFGIVQNYYKLFAVLKGTDIIALEPNDYISIVYIYNGALNFGINDYMQSYVTIEYINNQYEEIIV